MTTETSLTDTRAVDLAYKAGLHLADLGSAAQERAMVTFARAIEQAVLQSPEVQRLRVMRSYLWVASDALERICAADRAGECESIAMEALPTIREAMEKQP